MPDEFGKLKKYKFKIYGISGVHFNTHARIYDRILERCAPILFDGMNFREENAGASKAAKDLVNRKSERLCLTGRQFCPEKGAP